MFWALTLALGEAVVMSRLMTTSSLQYITVQYQAAPHITIMITSPSAHFAHQFASISLPS